MEAIKRLSSSFTQQSNKTPSVTKGLEYLLCPYLPDVFLLHLLYYILKLGCLWGFCTQRTACFPKVGRRALRIKSKLGTGVHLFSFLRKHCGHRDK